MKPKHKMPKTSTACRWYVVKFTWKTDPYGRKTVPPGSGYRLSKGTRQNKWDAYDKLSDAVKDRDECIAGLESIARCWVERVVRSTEQVGAIRECKGIENYD